MTEIKMWFERDEIVQNPRETIRSAKLSEDWGVRSGFVGVIYCTHEQGRKEYPSIRGLRYIKKVESYLRHEIEIYNEWATGNIYRCCITNGSNNNFVGEFYGFEFKDRETLKFAMEEQFDSQFHPYIDAAIDEAIAKFAL